MPWDHAALTSVLSFQDEKYAVTVYKRVLQNERRCWEHLAGLHSHYKPIRSILFGIQLDGSEPRLLSLGEDRQLVRPWESSTGDLGLRMGLEESAEGRSACGSAAPHQFQVVCQPGIGADLQLG